MGKIELTIHNPYMSINVRPEKKTTVFKRVMSRLSNEGLNPGKIIPLFIRFPDEYKVFGALTFNAGGSVSFFPDFYKLDQFDHLTLSANFIEKQGHLTESVGHNKFMDIQASKLNTGCYHLITFIFKDADLLMDAPEEIDLPEINYATEAQREKYNTWINECVTAGHYILDFPKEQGYFCIEILILARNEQAGSLAINRAALENSLVSRISLEKAIFNVNKYDIEPPDKCDFSMCLLAYKASYEFQSEFIFTVGRDPDKPLNKI